MDIQMLAGGLLALLIGIAITAGAYKEMPAIMDAGIISKAVLMILGRKGARIFWGILGIGWIAVGLMLITG